MKHPKTLAACLLLPAWLGLAGAASAQAAMPTHYDMPNGYGMAHGGSFNYWDGSYSGSGDRSTDYAPLSGGLGDLTDGVIATQSWIEVENVEGTGPYVGWNLGDPWVIDFHFAQTLDFVSVTLWHDDADGVGDISPPAAVTVTVGSRTQRFELSDPAGPAPFGSTLALGEGWQGAQMQLAIERFNNGLMLSEVTFVAAPVPEPASALLLAMGLVALRARRLRAQG